MKSEGRGSKHPLTETFLRSPNNKLVLFAILGVTAGPLGVVVATPLAAAGLVAVNMLYVEDVLGDKASSRST